jgi:hypothetical protein
MIAVRRDLDNEALQNNLADDLVAAMVSESGEAGARQRRCSRKRPGNGYNSLSKVQKPPPVPLR